MIHEKFRFIIFGRYPFDEQWRPLVGTTTLLAANSVDTAAGLGTVWAGSAAAQGGPVAIGFHQGMRLEHDGIHGHPWGQRGAAASRFRRSSRRRSRAWVSASAAR